MSNYGIKVTRAGFDVGTAADNQLLFSSSFPTLVVAFTGTLNAGANFTHNLGYAPVFWYQEYLTESGTPGNTNYTLLMGGSVSIDTTTLYNNASSTIRYYIFARNIRTNYTAPIINSTTQTQAAVNQNYGFKVSQPGSDVKTAGLSNLIDFSGLSLAGQPVRQAIIHQSGFQDNIPQSSTTNFSHNLGYAAMFLGFRRNNGNSAYALQATGYKINLDLTTQITYQVTISTTNLTLFLNLSSNQDFAYLILKDPAS